MGRQYVLILWLGYLRRLAARPAVKHIPKPVHLILPTFVPGPAQVLKDIIKIKVRDIYGHRRLFADAVLLGNLRILLLEFLRAIGLVGLGILLAILIIFGNIHGNLA